MLVEDDNNLREIYEARLLAEGYEIVSAKDGEEALATAVKEKPDLIISDVMMPKISGFDMLDILRSTPETKDTKVIMMTALSQAEDKERADKLGADKYLVKSQVTLEDVARVAKEVINGEASPGIDSINPATPAAATPPAPEATPVSQPDPASAVAPTVPVAEPPTPAAPVAVDPPAPAVVPADDPVATSELAEVQKELTEAEAQPVAATVEPSTELTTAPQTAAVDVNSALNVANTGAAEAVVPDTSEVESIGVRDAPTTAEETPHPLLAQTPDSSAEDSNGGGSSKRIIQPLNDLSVPATDLNDLAAKEEALEAAQTATPALPPVDPEAPVADTVITPTNTNSL